MSEPRYVWVARWGDFQHYRPERDRAPAWIKDYTKQLDDDDFRALTFATRGVLASLRECFAKSHGKVRGDPATLTQRLGQRVRKSHIEALVDAGFIELVSRDVLEDRLDRLYTSPRARVEGEREGERDTPLPPQSGGTSSRDNGENPRALGTNPRAIADADKPRRRATAWIANGLADIVPTAHLEEVIADEFDIADRELVTELATLARERRHPFE